MLFHFYIQKFKVSKFLTLMSTSQTLVCLNLVWMILYVDIVTWLVYSVYGSKRITLLFRCPCCDSNLYFGDVLFNPKLMNVFNSRFWDVIQWVWVLAL